MDIKQGQEEAYKKYTTSQDSDPIDEYAKAIIDCAERIGTALDSGKTPEEAEKECHGHELTGYMVGHAMMMVSRFSPRGEEMRAWWNKHMGGTGEEKGTINPAILSI